MKSISRTVVAVAAFALAGCASGVGLPTSTASLEAVMEVSEDFVATVWNAYAASNLVVTYRASKEQWVLSQRRYF